MRLLSPQALARTYNHPSKDPWEAVELYREATKYPDNWGAQRVATDMGVGRGEIRAWVDGDGMPDAARAIEFGEKHGWFDEGWSPTTKALARLTAITIACGSVVAQNFRPSWTPTDPVVQTQLEDDLDTVGTGVKLVRREGSKPDEYHPAKKASVLGRTLHVLGCPTGHKNASSTRSLPPFLSDSPTPVRTEWVELFVRDRGTKYPTKDTRSIQASRGRDYFDDLAELIHDVTGEKASASDDRVTISAAACRALGLRRSDPAIS